MYLIWGPSFCWQERSDGRERSERPERSVNHRPRHWRAVPAKRKARVLPKNRFWARWYPCRYWKYTNNTKYTEISRGNMTKNEKLVGGLDNIFIFYINNYQKIVWCLLYVFFVSTNCDLIQPCVCSACIRFAHTRLGGRHATRDVFIPGVMPETTRLSYIFTYNHQKSVCRYDGFHILTPPSIYCPIVFRLPLRVTFEYVPPEHSPCTIFKRVYKHYVLGIYRMSKYDLLQLS
jgi:hypothetical protein